jgi:methionyl aminopeptidase
MLGIQTQTTTTTTGRLMSASWRALRAISLNQHPSTLFTSQSCRLSGRSSLMRSHAFSAWRHGTAIDDEDEDNDISKPDTDSEHFGNYSVILPPEPFVFGVSHIPQRPVPSHIPRPPYLTSSTDNQQHTLGGPSDDGRIRLGGSEERRLREAARLAREVLEYAGTLVKVKAGTIILRPQR